LFDQQRFDDFVLDSEVYGFFEDAITLKSGRTSHFYANWRNAVADAFLADELSDFVLDFVASKGVSIDTFYGVPEGATKLGVLTQFKHAKRSPDYAKNSHALAMGRAKPKEHGAPKDKYFVGMPKGRTLVVEDVTTTGGSLLRCLEGLKEAGVQVVGVLSLTNRMEKRDDGSSVEEAVRAAGYEFHCMSSALDLLPRAFEKLAPGDEVGRAIGKEFAEYGVKPLVLLK